MALLPTLGKIFSQEFILVGFKQSWAKFLLSDPPTLTWTPIFRLLIAIFSCVTRRDTIASSKLLGGLQAIQSLHGLNSD